MSQPVTRRSAMIMAGAAATIPAFAAAPAEPSLAALARKSGREFGAATRIESLRDPTLHALLLHECAALTPELELKWAALEHRREDHGFDAMDELAAIARAAGKQVHGHALLWGRSVPGWAQAALRERPRWSIVRRHFEAVIPRYSHVIDRWDVVNEPIDAAGGDLGLRANAFLTAFGPSYIRRALEDARALAPRAGLMINEYGLEYDIAEERRRRLSLLRLIERLLKAGAPLDGIGLQAHLDLGKGPFVPKVLDDFLREIAGFGLFAMVTELDVREYELTAPAAERDARVADAARRYLDVALAHRHVVAVTCWGLSDRQSWLEVTPDDIARHPGAWRDGTSPGLNRGLPFDAALRRKPMYDAIAAAFRSATPVRFPR